MEEDSSDVVKINGEGRAMINKVSRWKKFGGEYIQVQGGSRKEMEKFLVGLKSCEEIINFNEWKIGNEKDKGMNERRENMEKKVKQERVEKMKVRKKRKMHIRSKMKEMWKRK